MAAKEHKEHKGKIFSTLRFLRSFVAIDLVIAATQTDLGGTTSGRNGKWTMHNCHANAILIELIP